MGNSWIIHMKWQLGRDEWVIYTFDSDRATIVDVIKKLHLEGVLPTEIHIVGPVKETL